MKFDVLTLFPEMFEPLNKSIIGRAIEKNLIEINLINIRDFSKDKHKKVDDTPYGGGAGMVIKPDVVYDAYNYVINNDSKLHKDNNSKLYEENENKLYEADKNKPIMNNENMLQNTKKCNKAKVIYMSPQGNKLNQKKVEELAKQEHLIILCGHYEGIDQRVIDKIVDEEISIGDYVLTGGEIPAMVLIDAVSRYSSGVISDESRNEESFANGMLEYPQYTRPEVFEGVKVPEVLLSGHHENIEKWRKDQSSEVTARKRPDLTSNKNN